MADDTTKRRLDRAVESTAQLPGSKRPYATLDLKATEIKITPVSNATQSYAASAARGSPVSNTTTPTSGARTSSETVPLPLTPSAYGTAGTETRAAEAASSRNPSASSGTDGTKKASPDPVAASKISRETPPPAPKRGGFFSHLAAGLAGGALVLFGGPLASPYIGLERPNPQSAGTTNVDDRLAKLEATSKANNDTAALTTRMAALEKSAERIPTLVESQSRLVAETKAALAASTSDSGLSEQITRIAALEDRFKALTEAGATNPNAGRLEQIAALTGKVSDLETALATQLTALRKGVADDVEARVASVAASAESAKSGAQRVDRDVATIKSEATVTAERLTNLQADNDRLAALLKSEQAGSASLKSQLQALQTTTAKPTDVEAAVKPVDEKLTALAKSVETLQTADVERRTNSERVLLSLELQNLKRALDNGQGYAPELAAVAKASGGKFDLVPLDAFKDTGVPPPATLAKEFRTVANAAIDADVEVENGGVMDQLIAGAKSVVRVRQANHAPDDKSTEAVVGRIETALKDGRLEEALTESQHLSNKAADAARPFLDRVAARVSVDRAVSKIEGQLKSSISSAPADQPAVTR